MAQPFTSETARSAALLSVQAKAKRRAELQARSLDPAVSLTMLRARLAAVDELISKTDDADTLDALTRAYERLFRVWQVLTRTPNPGQLRPAPERSTPTRRALIVDADSAPVSAPHPPAPPPGSDAVM